MTMCPSLGVSLDVCQSWGACCYDKTHSLSAFPFHLITGTRLKTQATQKLTSEHRGWSIHSWDRWELLLALFPRNQWWKLSEQSLVSKTLQATSEPFLAITVLHLLQEDNKCKTWWSTLKTSLILSHGNHHLASQVTQSSHAGSTHRCRHGLQDQSKKLDTAFHLFCYLACWDISMMSRN